MKKIVFACNWGKNPEKAWSGTSIGLYKELEKQYEIQRLDINPKTPLLLPLRCMEKLGLGRYDINYMKYYTKRFEHIYRGQENIKVFQFDECPNVNWANSYVFQDLCVSFLLDIYTNRKELIPFCGLENLSEKYLQKRVISQRAFYGDAKGIFTMGRWLADYLVEKEGIPKEKVYAVGGGINVDPNQIDDSHKEGNKFLFVGRDFVRKGGDIVVRAFKLLKQKNPQVELYIAGPPENPMEEKDRITGIYYLGEVNKIELNELYNKCDIFCMPSRFEAYGLVFPEALAFGLPCIGRNDFSMKEFIQEGQNGYLIDTDNDQKLADKMELALKNQMMKQYVKSQREWYIHEYSWENVVKRIIPVLENY